MCDVTLSASPCVCVCVCVCEGFEISGRQVAKCEFGAFCATESRPGGHLE